jgi:hypothetical protein
MPREEEIKLIAYQLWEARQRPPGCALEHWLEAELIWVNRKSAAERLTQNPPPTPTVAVSPSAPLPAVPRESKIPPLKKPTKKTVDRSRSIHPR